MTNRELGRVAKLYGRPSPTGKGYEIHYSDVEPGKSLQGTYANEKEAWARMRQIFLGEGEER